MAQTATDYLGIDAPVTLAEKSSLPVGGVGLNISTAPPTASGAGAIGGGSLSSVGTAQAPNAKAATGATGSPGVVTTTASGEPGVPGMAPDSDVRNAFGAGGSSIDAAALSSAVQALLKRLFGGAGGGGDSSTLDPAAFSLDGEEGGAVLDPATFSLAGEGGAVLDPANFSLGKGKISLNAAALPTQPAQIDALVQSLTAAGLDPGRFTMASDGGASVLDPSRFSLTGGEGGDALDPGKFSLGVDPSIDSSLDAGSFDPSSFLSLLFSGVAKGLSMLGGDAGKAGTAAGAAAPFVSDLILTGGEAISPLTLFNAPGIANTIFNLAEGDESAKIAAKRTQDAHELGDGIVGPLSKVDSPDSLMAALKESVGGSTVGDALLAILKTNASGTYFKDTGFGWLPDRQLAPLQQFLESQGFTGAEPTKDNVGGVGEIIASGGRFLPPDTRFAPARGIQTDSGYDFSNEGLDTQAQGGAVGWDRLLRRFGGVPDDAPMPFTQQSGFSNVPNPPSGDFVSGGEGGGQWQNLSAPLPNVDPAYLAALPPTVRDKITEDLRQQMEQAFADVNNQNGGGS